MLAVPTPVPARPDRAMQQEEELSPDELTALLSSYMPEIPGYRVLRRIGKGGMSQVWACRNRWTARWR